MAQLSYCNLGYHGACLTSSEFLVTNFKMSYFTSGKDDTPLVYLSVGLNKLIWKWGTGSAHLPSVRARFYSFMGLNLHRFALYICMWRKLISAATVEQQLLPFRKEILCLYYIVNRELCFNAISGYPTKPFIWRINKKIYIRPHTNFY